MIAAVTALAFKSLNADVVFTPRGPLGIYAVGEESVEECGADGRVLVELLPLRLRRRAFRGVRETPSLYKRVVDALVSHGVPLVPPGMAYAARNAIHVKIAICEDMPPEDASPVYTCGDSVTLEAREGCTPLGACASRGSTPIVVWHGSVMAVAPPLERQASALCAVVGGLGPHTAQH